MSITDLEMLQALRGQYEAALDQAQQQILERFPKLQISSRLKTVHTTVDKLRRETGMKLSRMQDIAGLRLVENMTLSDQDTLAQHVGAVLGDCRLVDRRAAPSYGYRAVHLYAKIEGYRLEVQIRTRLQDRWAQIVERLADRWGRQIRYGGDPDLPGRHDAPLTRREICELVRRMTNPIAMCEQASAQTTLDGKAPRIPAHSYCREVDIVLRQLASQAARIAEL
jgi:hypothetical protein